MIQALKGAEPGLIRIGISKPVSPHSIFSTVALLEDYSNTTIKDEAGILYSQFLILQKVDEFNSLSLDFPYSWNDIYFKRQIWTQQ